MSTAHPPKEILVIKRDGTKEPYDVAKIKKSIQMACEGLDVNPLELESKLVHFLKSGIKTRDIQLNVIQHAIQLATPSAPDWVNVAGRSLAMDEWANFSLRGRSFKEIVHYNVSKGRYTNELLNFYTDSDLEELGACIKMNRDLDYSYASLITAKKKYLDRYELNQHMHMVNAMRFGQFEPVETRVKFVKEAYNALSMRKISLATPFLSNLRKGGNVASCFILALEDDLDSIFNNIKRVAHISKNGGGLGIFLGFIRAKGSEVNGFPNAAGSVVQWVKILNDTLVAVNQSFTADAPIKTKQGNVYISGLKVGDEVLTHDGSYRTITDIFKSTNVDPIHDVTTTSGMVSVTAGHPVMVVNGNTDELDENEIIVYIESGKIDWKWVDIKDLQVNDYVISTFESNVFKFPKASDIDPEMRLDHNNESLKLNNVQVSKVVSNIKTDKSKTVYDLKVDTNENYVVDGLGIVHNGGKRSGAGTVALPIWHNDIQDFLDMQTEHGDLRLKAYDVFPQVTVPDIFMERDRNKESWTTFCPFEVKKKLGIDIRGLYGVEFTNAYLKIEEAAKAGKLTVTRTVENARDITKLIMRTQFETGLPYIAFTDTINEVNPNKGDGSVIIEGTDGKTYTFTMGDKINTKNRGEISAADLNEDDEIILDDK